AGDQLAHGLRVRADLRPFADHGHVRVAHPPAALAQQRVAVAQEHAAVGPLPARVGGREMDADVAQRERAEHRIAKRVQDHVAVAVRGDAALVGHAHAAEHDVVAFAEGVDVVTLADADAHGRNSSTIRFMSTCRIRPAASAATLGSLNRPSPASSPTRPKASPKAPSAEPSRNARRAWSAQSTVSSRTISSPIARLASARRSSLTWAMSDRSGCSAIAENIHCTRVRWSSAPAAE